MCIKSRLRAAVYTPKSTSYRSWVSALSRLVLNLDCMSLAGGGGDLLMQIMCAKISFRYALVFFCLSIFECVSLGYLSRVGIFPLDS